MILDSLACYHFSPFIPGLSIHFIKIHMGEEGKDERGKQITSTSYMMSSPIFPIGWLLIEAYHNYRTSFLISLSRLDMDYCAAYIHRSRRCHFYI
ncbi:hypothetical protein LD39_20605 [Halobacillus sp. BBL2006]|nr:hypothetical protein LD39_20605 [Halobacillus sp. BBL2006]